MARRRRKWADRKIWIIRSEVREVEKDFVFSNLASVDIMKWIFKVHNIELDIYLIDHVKLPSFLPVNISAMILRCLQQDLFTIHPLPIQALNGIFNQSSNQWMLCLLSSPFPCWFKVQNVAELLPEIIRLNVRWLIAYIWVCQLCVFLLNCLD